MRFVRIQFDTWLWTFTWTWNSRICREVFPSIRKVFLWIWSFLWSHPSNNYRWLRISPNFKYRSSRLIRCHLYMVCQLILRKWYFLTRKVKRRFPDYANYLLCNHWFHIFIEVSCWERVKGLPTENCPNCLYFNISYFPVETPFQVYPKKFKKVPSVFQEESKECSKCVYDLGRW